jgi:flagellar assembly protein FliH
MDAKPIDWTRAPGEPVRFQSPMAAPKEPSSQDTESLWKAALQNAELETKNRSEAEFQRGLAEGEVIGRRRAAAKVDPLLERLARTIADLAACRDRFRKESEKDLVGLSLAIARRVLRRELIAEPDAILGLVKVALEKISLREVHRVRLHPEDAPVVRRHLAQIQAPAGIEIEADSSLERGAVIFETSRGSLDASAETQLAQIERGFADMVRRQE